MDPDFFIGNTVPDGICEKYLGPSNSHLTIVSHQILSTNGVNGTSISPYNILKNFSTSPFQLHYINLWYDADVNLIT